MLLVRVGRPLACAGLLMVATACSMFQGWQDAAYRDYHVAPFTKDDFQSARNTAFGSPTPCLSTDAGSAANRGPCEHGRYIYATALLSLSYERCERHMATIFGNEAAWNIATGTGTTLAAAAATGVPGVGAKTAFGALATVFSGERSLVNEQVYKTVVVPKIAESIRTERISIRQKIATGLTKPITEYPVVSAELDAIDFYRACSFMNGLTSAFNTAAEQKYTASVEQQSKERALESEIARVQRQIAEAKLAKAPTATITALETELGKLEKERVKLRTGVDLSK